jgi:HPt (histidine-containing phosphotransfer) domain-containing protein
VFNHQGVFDYSYLDRISSDSKALHVEVLESFLAVGRKSKDRVSNNRQRKDVEGVAESLKELFSSLRILGLNSMLLEAESLEIELLESRQNFSEDLDKRLSKFSNDLERALQHAEVEIQKYRKGLNV